jgi:hypothetical protein
LRSVQISVMRPHVHDVGAPRMRIIVEWDSGDGLYATCLICRICDIRVSPMPIIHMQRRRRHVLRSRKLTALAMGAHARLGEASALHTLDNEVLGLIAQFVL